jgi:hypothetical protein
MISSAAGRWRCNEDRLGRSGLRARERQELAREARAGLDGAPDRGELRVVGEPVRPAPQQVRVGVDDREQVVEVVRDAAGQPPDRLELLRLAQHVLDALPARRLEPKLLVGLERAARLLLGDARQEHEARGDRQHQEREQRDLAEPRREHRRPRHPGDDAHAVARDRAVGRKPSPPPGTFWRATCASPLIVQRVPGPRSLARRLGPRREHAAPSLRTRRDADLSVLADELPVEPVEVVGAQARRDGAAEAPSDSARAC